MRCEYCDVEVMEYPRDGLCVCCGAKLPPRPVDPVCVPQPPHTPLVSGVNCCPKCRNTRLVQAKRGFSWGLAILGFFLIPGFGLLLGFCGSKKPRIQCCSCSHKWKRP